jgi:hypothetical protein
MHERKWVRKMTTKSIGNDKPQARRPELKRQRPLVGLAIGALAVIGVLSTASAAMATPKGVYTRFSDCPAHATGVTLCQYAETTGGEVAIGSVKVPINKTLVLQGGAAPAVNQNEFDLVPALDGNSLSKTELNVPGGLADLVNCEEIKGSGVFEVLERSACKAIFESETTGVTATTEIVANTEDPAILNTGALIIQTSTALKLPVRVHLKNPLLGSSCYIGSEAHPIVLHLTTGTTSPELPNKPISGKRGTYGEEEEGLGDVISLSENSLVDNAFSVPTAEGCGEFFSFLIDPIVDSKLGLPSADGHNTAILNGKLWITEAEAVAASE